MYSIENRFLPSKIIGDFIEDSSLSKSGFLKAAHSVAMISASTPTIASKLVFAY